MASIEERQLWEFSGKDSDELVLYRVIAVRNRRVIAAVIGAENHETVGIPLDEFQTSAYQLVVEDSAS